MVNHLNLWLVPLKANRYQPHLTRPIGLLLVSMVFVGLFWLANFTNDGRSRVLGYATDIKTDALIKLINSERAEAGLSTLTASDTLNRAAVAKATAMIGQDYWSHYAPDGTPPWQFIERAGYHFAAAGENLARDFNTNAGVVAGWMNSQPHRANLLNGKFQELGLGVVDGELSGQETTLVVAMLAAPAGNLAVGAGKALGAGSFAAAQSPTTFSVINPLAPGDTLTWAAQAAIPVLGIMKLMLIGQHLVLVRHKVKWDKGIHRHPMFIFAGLLVISVILIVTSYGEVW